MRKIVSLVTVALLMLVLSVPLMAQDATEEAPAPTGSGYFRVAHLTPAVPTIVVFRDGAPVLSGIRFGSFTRWIELSAGTYSFQIGANSNAAAAAYGPVEVTLENGDFVTLAAIGTEDGDQSIAVIPQDYSPIADRQARVTIFHAIEGVDPVDILADGEVLFDALAYPGSFFTPAGPLNDGVVSIDVPAGGYDLAVVPNGLTEPVVIDLTGTELEAGVNYFVAAAGTPDAPEAIVVATSRADYLASIVDTAAGSEDLSILVAALQAADPAILEALGGPGPFTVFAPSNAAIEALLDELGLSAEQLLANTDLLNQVLRYHVVGAAGGGELTAAELTDGRAVLTLANDFIDVTVGEDGTVTLNGNISVVTANILTTNGVVHVIDGVLLPPTE